VRVRIMPPDAEFPDRIKIAEAMPSEAEPPEKKLEVTPEEDRSNDRSEATA
jgi:hypothetical protein